jgi:DNA-binding GntR family transcriptional regulator
MVDHREQIEQTSGVEQLPPLQPGRLQESIYRSLREAIMSGLLTPGAHLRQVELANHYGTSQAPVREALQRLTQEGLVETYPHRGSFVTQLSMSEVEEVYSLRAELESWAVRRFIRRMVPGDIEALVDAVDAMNDAAAVDDGLAFSEADARFHRLICQGASSTLLLQVWEPMDSRVRGMMSIANALFDAGLEFVASTHYPIIDALERRDEDLAVERVHEHLQRAWNRIQQRLEEDAASVGSISA